MDFPGHTLLPLDPYDGVTRALHIYAVLARQPGSMQLCPGAVGSSHPTSTGYGPTIRYHSDRVAPLCSLVYPGSGHDGLINGTLEPVASSGLGGVAIDAK